MISISINTRVEPCPAHYRALSVEFDPGGMEKALIASARRSLGANDVSWNREWMFLLLFVSVFRFRTNVDSA